MPDNTARYDAAHIAARVDNPSAQGLASHVARLIRSGELRPGDRLPHVRDLAEHLRISPATVSSGWGLLRKRGLVVGKGKAGMRVSSPVSLAAGLGGLATFGNQLDLRLLYPDPDLLPELTQALVSAAGLADLDEYYEQPILPQLREVVERDWPFPCSDFVVTNGSADALWSTLHALSVPGDRVLVESPTQPQMLSLMTDLGLEAVPVASDREGPKPAAVRKGLALRPVAFFYQPRTHVPTGTTVSERRRTELAAAVARDRHMTVIEYDDLGLLNDDPVPSIGAERPDQTVFIRSFEKSHSPDLRIAVVGGAPLPVESIHAQIRLTRQWSSRILQATVAWLIRDPGTTELLSRAREIYADRCRSFADAVRARGGTVDGAGGFCVWVRVVHEQAALDFLSQRGVLAFPGESSYAGAAEPHLRIATSRMSGDLGELAALVSRAANLVP